MSGDSVKERAELEREIDRRIADFKRACITYGGTDAGDDAAIARMINTEDALEACIASVRAVADTREPESFTVLPDGSAFGVPVAVERELDGLEALLDEHESVVMDFMLTDDLSTEEDRLSGVIQEVEGRIHALFASRPADSPLLVRLRAALVSDDMAMRIIVLGDVAEAFGWDRVEFATRLYLWTGTFPKMICPCPCGRLQVW